MTRRVAVLAVTVLIVGVLLTGVVLAAGGFHVSWYVMGGGGGTSSSSAYTVEATVGQAVAATSKGGSFQVCAGFWCGNVVEWRVYIARMLKGN